MCEEAKLKEWARGELNRRQIGVLAGAAAVTACAPEAVTNDAPDDAPEPQLIDERNVTFETPDGTMDAFFTYRVGASNAGIIFWPDIASLRETKRDMARRLAGEGFAVLVLNPYYRDVAGQQFEDFADFIENDGFARVSPWREKLDADSIGRDTVAAVEWLDAQSEMEPTLNFGTQGYCMGGPFAVWSAAAAPSRIKAAASFHGGGLVREDYEKSPHKLLDQTQAAYLFAIAQDDHEQSPGDQVSLSIAASTARRPAKTEVYAGDHGWTVPDSPAYNEEAAEQAYADLMTLYGEHIWSMS